MFAEALAKHGLKPDMDKAYAVEAAALSKAAMALTRRPSAAALARSWAARGQDQPRRAAPGLLPQRIIFATRDRILLEPLSGNLRKFLNMRASPSCRLRMRRRREKARHWGVAGLFIAPRTRGASRRRRQLSVRFRRFGRFFVRAGFGIERSRDRQFAETRIQPRRR
jgi:hypothetical protein